MPPLQRSSTRLTQHFRTPFPGSAFQGEGNIEVALDKFFVILIFAGCHFLEISRSSCKQKQFSALLLEILRLVYRYKADIGRYINFPGFRHLEDQTANFAPFPEEGQSLFTSYTLQGDWQKG